jgi:hypothetical protein
LLTFAALMSDASDISVDRDFALLLLVALLLSPLGWTYYLLFLLGPLSALFRSWWIETRTFGDLFSFVASWRNRFLLAAVPGLIWPVTELNRWQPHAWATVTIGSMYFWATFFLWAALIADWRARGGTFAEIPRRLNALLFSEAKPLWSLFCLFAALLRFSTASYVNVASTE